MAGQERWEAGHTVIAEALCRGANLGVVANIATLVACATREGRHCNELLCLFRDPSSVRKVTGHICVRHPLHGTSRQRPVVAATRKR